MNKNPYCLIILFLFAVILMASMASKVLEVSQVQRKQLIDNYINMGIKI